MRTSLRITATLTAILANAAAQIARPPAIASITVCNSTGASGQGSCPAGTRDTAQLVLAPDGNAINSYHGMTGISDEHQSVFSPGTPNANSDYLFFVATRVQGGAPSTSLVALSGGSGPAPNGQWTLDFAKTDGYGAYPNGLYADIFVSSTTNCPTVDKATDQDQTFDQDYAAPGSILIDPTAAPGSLLMIYEGTNTCLGSTGGGKNNFYSMVGAATSTDYGKTWPTYRAKPGFNFVDLPGQNNNQAPGAPNGALGAGVCMGNSCTATPPASYGRYPVLGPSVAIATAAATGKPVPSSMGDSEMSAFLDDVSSVPTPFVYITYNYKPGSGALADPQAPPADLMIARGQLNGASAPLNFSKWNGKAFAAAGIGGYDSPVFPAGSFANCGAKTQTKFGSSISFVDATQQYLLLFVCDSPGDPAAGQSSGAARGGAWFYSTSYSLSDPTQWSAPQEVTGSWSAYDTSGGCSDYPGFYPTAMSLGAKPGHLGTSGYIFYLWGCQTDNTPPPGRRYSSRMFTINLVTTAPPPLTISTTQLPAGTVGVAYSQTLAATGGTGTYNWTVSSGALPDGLTLSAQGVIAGIPTTAGNANFTVQVTDSNGDAASEAFTIAFATPALLLSPDGTMVYDTVNNVTWLADFNFAATNQFGLPVCQGGAPQPCVNASGSMRYDAAVAWVAAMNAANYQGQSNWQLPTTPAVDNSCPFTGTHGNSFGFGCEAGALGSIYYDALSLTAPNTAVPIPGNAVGPFSNFQPYYYWSQTPGGADAAGGYVTFSFNTGFKDANTVPNFMYVLPMIQGQIPGTPSPAGNGLQVNPGGQTVYDPMTNATWLANANLAASNTFGLPRCTDQNTPRICVGQDGAMSWDSASMFIAKMNNGGGYLGQTSWQLPPADPNCPNYGCDGDRNPMGNLFYDQLGFTQGTPVVATPNVAVGPFDNVQPYIYWSCEAPAIQNPCQTDGPSPNFEWSFSFGNGFLGTDVLADEYYVTAYFVGPPPSPAGPVISTSTPLPSGTAGSPYSQALAATGGAPPDIWSLAAGALPDGLTLTPDGNISGTPSTAGTYSFTVQVTDSNGATASQVFTVAVAPATLVLSPDGSTVYDTVNNITWLADFNFAGTNQFGLPMCQGSGPQPCVNASGSMRYAAAVAWVTAMNAANYLGHNNWQLPTTPLVDGNCAKVGPNGGSFGFGCTAGALDSIYNAFLKAPNTAVPLPNNTVGPFSNIQPYLYWSQSSASGGNATFSFATGWEGANALPNLLYIWPMIPGKIAGAPPATGNGLQVNPGGQTVYDPMTNITWLANANLPAINTFGLPTCKDPATPAICVAQDGAMTYDSATQFLAAMNSSAYLGQTNWQLPTIDTACMGYKCDGTANPMGNLFYDQLGLSPGVSAVAVPNITVGPFHNIQPYLYWSCQGATIQSACQTDGPSPNFEWSYSFGSGFEGTDLLANDLYVTAYFVGK